VRDNRLVGSGWHAEFGGLHAERVALDEAGAAAKGATLYCTLEPCAHTGKQPPCVDAIVAAGISRVVVAMRDPNPVAQGGLDRLKQAGIAVEHGVLAAQAAQQNFRFLHAHRNPARPFVAVKLAVSMDGMVADAAGESRWVSGAPAREWVHWLRAGFGGVAVGGATAVRDNVRLTVRGVLQPAIAPARVLFDRGGRVTPAHGIFADAAGVPLLMVTGSQYPPERRRELERAGAQVVVADELGAALEAIAAAGIDALLVEGGGRLAGALLRDGLVDRIYQVQSPVWLGRGLAAWSGLGTPSIDTAPRWHVIERLALGDDTILVMER
jgi:diaminohydroxyphosphoribosylaminopyrimidine deaminase/5-amino-6-(5-phosphoribosylamino)uracil reductase